MMMNEIVHQSLWHQLRRVQITQQVRSQRCTVVLLSSREDTPTHCSSCLHSNVSLELKSKLTVYFRKYMYTTLQLFRVQLNTLSGKRVIITRQAWLATHLYEGRSWKYRQLEQQRELKRGRECMLRGEEDDRPCRIENEFSSSLNLRLTKGSATNHHSPYRNGLLRAVRSSHGKHRS